MRILDKYWTNYESPETIDRKTRPPVLNFALVKRINGRSGNEPEPFEWKGEFLEVDNALKNPEPLECTFQATNNEIHCASSTLAAIYHKNAHGIEGMVNRCKVNVFGKCVQIFPCERRYQFENRIVDCSMDEKESFDIGQRFGVAIDTLFTSPGEVTENTNAEVDKLAYFCVFEREMEGFKLHIRKEVDIMLRLRNSYMPIELKTRTWLGMNKRAFFYQLIPSLFTRCYLIDCFTVMIAVREEKNASSIIKVLFFEDIRDIAFNQYGNRKYYFRFLLRTLMKHRQAVTEIEYTRTSIHFNSEGKPLTENLDDKLHPPNPYFPLQGDRPDLVICRDPEFDEMEPTLSDLCTLRRWATEERWCLHKAASTIYVLAWRFESLLDLLLRHTERIDLFTKKIIKVFMLDAEETPSEDEIAFACHVHLGNNMTVEVEFFDDIEDLEGHLEKHDLYENCSHALVLLGSGQSLPGSFAIRNTDIFHICNFPRKEIMDMVTLPEKIAVFGTCQQCVDANEKLSKMDMFPGYEDFTYFFAMDTNIVLNMNFKNLLFVTEQTEILELLKMYDFPCSINKSEHDSVCFNERPHQGAKARTEDGYIAEEYQDSEWLAPAHENIQTVTPPCCQKPSIEDVNHVLVSTMNGKLIALDASNNGNVLWELDLEGAPLLSGTLSGMPPMEANGKWYHLVPALDGSLYMYSRNDRLLEPIPLNTEVLLQSSVRIAQDAVAGGKIVTTTGVDPLSGEIRYHCTATNCNNGVNEDVQSTLVFRRSTNSVRAVNALTGIERWNLSVAEYDASLVKKSSTLSSNRLNGLRILVQPPDGVVTAYDECGNMVWSQSVGSHIVKSWKMESGELEEISLFDAYNIHTLAVADEFNQPDSRIAETLFYLGMSNNDPFIIHSGAVKNELQRMARNALDLGESIVHQPGSQLIPADKRAYFIQGKTIDELLRFSFGKTYTAKQNSNTALIDDFSSELTVVNPNRVDGHVGSCPNGDGVSLIREDDMRSATFDHASGDKGWYVLKPGSSKVAKSPFFLNKAKQCAARFSQHVDSWWSFSIGMMAGLSTGIATLGTVFAYFCYRRMQRKLLPLNSIPRKLRETRETSSGPSLNGEPGSVPSTPSEPTPIAAITRERRTTSGNSNSQSESFTSKFFHDFEPVKLLGHGGFGYVFKAKHRLDEGYYAVKRIAVADNDRAIQKVLREVRAMAKLDHRGIIRYYHTWIERPPPGWQEENDRDTLADLKIRRKTFDEEAIEKQKIVEESTQDPSSAPMFSRQESIKVPAMPEDSNDGSWLDSQPGNQDDTSSSSGSDGSESDVESSDSENPLKPQQRKLGKFTSQNSVEASDGIIFGHSASLSKSKNSKSSEDLWKQSKVQQMVLVTSVDEELLPCRNTESFVYLYIQMQLCQEKTLHSWLKRHKQQEHRSLPVMKAWLVQLCSAVNYIHSQGMIHRDLKPQNIFFFDDNHQHLKVGDLGLITKGSSPDEQAEKHSPNGIHSSHTDNVGTRGYMSPEQIANQAYTLKIDVFSLGLIFCELIIPFQTFMERSRTLGSLQRGEVPDILKYCGKDERKMVLWMTKMNSTERPTTDDILSSEYLADVDEDFGAGSRRRYRSERNSSFDRKSSAHF